ncbi:MAG: replication initiator protein [Microviridae sp.]|nr:MAG: replication initiator protein [Microviridae sp.]
MPCSNVRQIRGNTVPCGSCRSCKKVKEWKIQSRILMEINQSEKSWFCTLTLRRNMTDALGYRLIQRWFKRIRKRMPVRYACVAEHGSNSTMRLHYHAVVSGPQSLSYRILRNTWRGGFSEVTLISGNAKRAARYSAKTARYVTKAGARFRFSQAYGSQAGKRMIENEFIAPFVSLGIQAIRLNGHNLPLKLFSLPAVGHGWQPYPDDLLLDADRERAKMRREEKERFGREKTLSLLISPKIEKPQAGQELTTGKRPARRRRTTGLPGCPS